MNPPPGGFQQGGWYEGKQYWNGTFSQPGQIHTQSNQPGAGQMVSAEVNRQSAAAQGKSFEEFNSFINANQLQSPVSVPYSTGSNGSYINGLSGEVERARKALEQSLKQQKEEADKKIVGLREKEQQTLEKVGELTQPFREEIEIAERERLYVNENFEANQQLVSELETLLTEGNDLIRQQKEVTGLAAVRNPRIQKTLDDVASRAGVIDAVLNARNGQIAQAYNMIDRTVGAITADRQDRLSYYETILNLTNRDILLLDADAKNIAAEQLNLLKTDLSRAQATSDYVKQLMLSPETAAFMGEAGVSLNDSVEQINGKLSQASYSREIRELANKLTTEGAIAIYNPSSIPSAQLVSFTDSRGNKHHYKVQPKAGSGTSTSETVANIYKDLRGGGSSSGNTPAKFPAGPYKPGEVWIDPKTGIAWMYTGSGWRVA